MGEFFSSFEESWEYFLEREQPLEDFFAEFPDDDSASHEGWLVEPSEEIKEAARPLQETLAGFPWLFPVPDHFLHVWIGIDDRVGDACQRLEPFPIVYANLNCFHAAVVVEVDGPLRQLVEGTSNDLPTFLPHMTLAVTRGEAPPDELRALLKELRRNRLGAQVVREVKRVRFPAGRRTLFQPWSLEQLVSLQ
jgi:2'-5' RNA ligase